MELSAKAQGVIRRHTEVAGVDVSSDGRARTFADGVRVLQWENASSVYFKDTGRMWVHNHNPRFQSFQELYFHSVQSMCNTVTCSHTVKFWDLRRHASVREHARIQGFPDSFVLPEKRWNKCIGNAVVVTCARHALSLVIGRDECVRHLDLCAGIGGFSFALSDITSNVEDTYFSEIMPAAINCYKQNFPTARALGDAYNVTEWPHVDLVTAGFPCQPFSSANTFKSEGDTRRDFFQHVLVAIRESGATRVVLENVPQMRTMDGGARFNSIIETLSSWGFRTTHAVLNSSDFGVPQVRRRLYICARRDDEPLRDVGHYQPSDPVVLGDIIDPQ
tara:strand:+ start:2946 stop:3944 length:999 start_codon:yes stop_codon:yes gene_type:complete